MRLPQHPPDPVAILTAGESPPIDRILAVGPTPGGRYFHWDELRRRPAPEGLTHEQWWAGTKMARMGAARTTPIVEVDANPFSYVLADPVLEKLHKVDQRAAGRLAAPAQIVNTETRDRYIVSSLIEEAISSSQLEGAATTRKVAKEMLRTSRHPRDRSEQMILNNYRAMYEIRERIQDPMSVDLILHLHRTLTEGTLDNPDSAGRIQRPDEERVRVWDERDDSIIHTPPPAEDLPDRLELLCAFANGDLDDSGFTHPLVRAILLHFWLAYDHPFEDGNGRTARALFYWSALRSGYWLLEFVSISRILQQGPAKYTRAFLFSETDDGDLTYFLDHQLDVIGRSLDQLLKYVERKAHETRVAERAAHAVHGLNHRQLALISHALRHPGFRYTYNSHAGSHGIVRQTARTDLLELASLGLVEKGKSGRAVVFVSPEDLAERIDAL